MKNIIKINGERYQCLVPVKKVLDIDSNHFNLRNCYEVVYLCQKTGKLSVGIWGHQFRPQCAIDLAQSYINIEKYEVIDAYPIIELIEDEDCLRRRLKYQYKRYCEAFPKTAQYPNTTINIATRYNETLKRLGGPEQNRGEFYLSMGEVV